MLRECSTARAADLIRNSRSFRLRARHRFLQRMIFEGFAADSARKLSRELRSDDFFTHEILAVFERKPGSPPWNALPISSRKSTLCSEDFASLIPLARYCNMLQSIYLVIG
jgi:hypothetical protein